MNPLRPKKKRIVTTQWEKYFKTMLISWGVFIVILLFVSYYPPPQSSSSTLEVLCEGVRFITYALTGVTLGYPIGEGSANVTEQ